MASVGPRGNSTSASQVPSGGLPGGQLLPGDSTDAVLTTNPPVRMPPGGYGPVASATMPIVTTAPGARSPRAQTTVWPSADVHAGLSADTNVRPVGRTSVTTTAAATTGPVLVTVTV
jgi:hypothetical protein